MKTHQSSKTSTKIRISRDRKEVISNYATAAVCLYGVITVEEFVDVFNHYEDTPTTPEKVLFVIMQFSVKHDVEYTIVENIISGYEFQPQFEDYKENVDSIRSAQIGKPRYLPSKEEFLKYADMDYLEPKQPYTDLKAYILKHNLTSYGEGIDGVDGDLLDLHEMIRFGVETSSVYDYFTERGYHFENLHILEGFAHLIMDVNNNTRMYDNNGFTPYELVGKTGRRNATADTNSRIDYQMAPRIGRTDPCPCGSGLKYKNCCGK